MREIKFRAWSIIGRRMYDWEQMHAYPAHKLSQYFRYGDVYEVLQYTGLKDKNGKEIYEGDVVKLSCPSSVFEVRWFNGGFYFYPNKSSSIHHLPWALVRQYESSRGEVIGNIYENPELLEAKNVR